MDKTYRATEASAARAETMRLLIKQMEASVERYRSLPALDFWSSDPKSELQPLLVELRSLQRAVAATNFDLRFQAMEAVDAVNRLLKEHRQLTRKGVAVDNVTLVANSENKLQSEAR